MKGSKLTFVAMVLFLTGAAVFAGGGRQQSAASSGTPVLQIGMQRITMITDYSTNTLTRYVERLHNVRLDFYMLPSESDDLLTRLSLLAASNELPETIWVGGLPTTRVLELGNNGFFLSLNRYFGDASKTPYFNRLPRDVRDKMLLDTRSADGNNYGFPHYYPGAWWNVAPYRLLINRAWLSKLGLAIPTTTDELRNVLLAFRDRDPNGNGRRDAIGILAQAGSNWSWGGNTFLALINSFIYFNEHYDFDLDSTGNTVIASYTQPNFRKALQWLNGLYREGLIEPSSFTIDQQGYTALVNATPSVVGFTSQGNEYYYPDPVNNPQALEMYPNIAPLTGPDGISYTPYNEIRAMSRAFITNKAKNVDLALKVMDSFYDLDLTLLADMGEENVDWTRDPARLAGMSTVAVSQGLYPAVTSAYTKESRVYAGTPHNVNWAGSNPGYFGPEWIYTRADFNDPFDPNAITPYWLTEVIDQQEYAPRRPRYLLPELQYSAADGLAIGPIRVSVTDYLRATIPEFIAGIRDINNDAAWNAYLRELDNMGMQTWLRIAQQTYNRMR
jgi:putative aldouronate transport system substrate-binding protein